MQLPNAQVLAFLDSINTMNMQFKEISTQLKNCSAPSDLIDIIESIVPIIDKLSGKTMLGIQNIKSVREYYKVATNNLANLYTEYKSKTDELESKGIKPSISADFYKEEDLITDISITIEGDFDTSVSNVSLSQLVEPRYYSTLEILKRMNSDGSLLQIILDSTMQSLDKIECTYNNAKILLNNFKADLVNSETIQKLCENDVPTFNRIRAYTENTSIMKEPYEIMKQIFQVYSELCHNFLVYERVVDTYYDTTGIESCINPNIPIEFC